MIVASESDRRRLTQLDDTRGEASLPVILDWQEWWSIWKPKIADDVGRVGWVLFIMDALEKITDQEVIMARLLRGKGGREILPGWSEKEWQDVSQTAAEACAWFEEYAPGVKRDAPEWAQFVIAGLGGLFAVQARLARELRAAQEQGYTTVALETTESGGVRMIGELS